MPDALVLAIAADNAEAILDGERAFEYRTRPPARLPARAYLAVAGSGGVIGECELGPPARHTAKGWALPVSRPRRYRSPHALSKFGLARTPRSFRYVPR